MKEFIEQVNDLLRRSKKIKKPVNKKNIEKNAKRIVNFIKDTDIDMCDIFSISQNNITMFEQIELLQDYITYVTESPNFDLALSLKNRINFYEKQGDKTVDIRKKLFSEQTQS